ncbi:MAG: PH domain-containing protein [Actinomycetota bacterium]|nr:PH domain-containing protein [Actinomycetota bacterium]
MDYRFRPGFGRVLTILVGCLCVFALVTTMLHDGLGGGLRSLPWLALIGGGCWAVFWRPEVVVDDAGVHLCNVLRTIDLPWPAIQRVDTRWALALTTPYGTFTAWAAPTSSRLSGKEISPGDLQKLPSSTFGPGKSIRPGDSPLAPSGQAAMVIRRHWEDLRDAGHLDNPQLEFDNPPIRWHLTTILVGLGLAALGFLGIVA